MAHLTFNLHHSLSSDLMKGCTDISITGVMDGFDVAVLYEDQSDVLQFVVVTESS